MLTGIAHLAVVDLAEIHPVLEEIGERSLGEGDPADRPAGRQRAQPRDVGYRLSVYSSRSLVGLHLT
jgi:hypothetical protein